VTDQNPETTMTEQDEKDLATLLGEAGDMTYNPVLRIWQEILSEKNRKHGARVTIPWANGICGKYQGMTFALMPAFVALYFDFMARLVEVLEVEISTDPDCLKWHSVEEDLEENAGHYKALLTDWQKTILAAELAWDPTHAEAPAYVAALGEISQFFFGEIGLTGHLGAIGFNFTEEDQQELAEALTEFQAELLEEGK
jgi:hypothetical protein